MFDRFTDNAKKTMRLSIEAALHKHDDAIEPEHILTGLLQLPDSVAVQLLKGLQVDTDGLQNLFPAGETKSGSLDQLPFVPPSKRVLELAVAAAAELGHNYLGSQHLLLGLIREGKSAAAQVLMRNGVTSEAITQALSQVSPQSERGRVRLLLISNSTMHGGGYLEHCAHEIGDFLGEDKRVMFVPYALQDHDGYARKAREAFAEMGHELTSIHAAKDSPAALLDADAVFIGGGNTFRLLSELCSYGLLSAIRDRALAGMPYIGSSAGTNVATLSIRTTNDMPIMQPPSFRALQLVPFQINPHYLDPDPASSHMGETREERILQFHEENSEPVLALREGCMLRVRGDHMELRGTTKARLFRRDQPATEYAPPCDLSFLLADAPRGVIPPA